MSFAGETLMAYVDGELDAQTRAAVAQAVTTDPEIARHVAQQRLLRASLQGAFAAVLEEPVPEHLVHAARTGAGGFDAGVDPAGGATAARLRRILPQWGALAASLVVGLLIGTRFLGGGDGLLRARHGSLVAQGPLAQALAGQLASAQAPNSAVEIGISFRAHSGEYCRSFWLRASAASGLACHAAEGWRIDVLERIGPVERSSERPARSALAPAVSQVVQAVISGEPLDAKAERAARDRGWPP